jgi:hypothetical protein
MYKFFDYNIDLIGRIYAVLVKRGDQGKLFQ